MKTKYLLFFRLQNPYECPFNGSRRQDCACRNDYLAAGFTIFSKIRFDVASMQIKSKHFVSFSQFEHSIEIVCGHNYQIIFWSTYRSSCAVLGQTRFLFKLRIQCQKKKKKKERTRLLTLFNCPKWSSGMNVTDSYFLCELPSFSKILFPLFHFILVHSILFSLEVFVSVLCLEPTQTLADTK